MKGRSNYLLLLLLFAVSLSGCNYGNEQYNSERNALEQTIKPDEEKVELEIKEKPEIGYMAPNFDFKNSNGEIVDLNSLQGKPVFINFWASW